MVIVIIVFGAGKLPQVGAGLGKAIKNFRSGIKERPDEAEAPALTDPQETTPEKGR